MNDYQCVHARFLFWNGQKRYTVAFHYGVMTWYIFNDEETTGALFHKNINPKKSKTPNRDEAEFILTEYLDK